MLKIFTPLIILGILGLLTGTVIWHWSGQSFDPDQFKQNLINLQNFTTDDFQGFSDLAEVTTPGPLKGTTAPAGSGLRGNLTIEGILQATNHHRTQAGLSPLAGNSTLNQAARLKLDDLFDQQYFEHVSPQGIGPADLVDQVGYQYVRVGENLALGDFASNTDLVQAWMDSPGHRANILKPSFEELGLAVAPGIFEGQRTWIAVQTFATPLSSCPAVDPSLRTRYDAEVIALENLSEELKQRSQEIDNDKRELERLANEANQHYENGENEQGDAKRAEYEALRAKIEQQVETYNQRVNDLNSRNQQLKALSQSINQQVRAFNDCLQA